MVTRVPGSSSTGCRPLRRARRIVEGLSILNEDGVYTIIGTTPASGVYRGRQHLLDRLRP
jgi:hypothetical protein